MYVGCAKDIDKKGRSPSLLIQVHWAVNIANSIDTSLALKINGSSDKVDTLSTIWMSESYTGHVIWPWTLRNLCIRHEHVQVALVIVWLGYEYSIFGRYNMAWYLNIFVWVCLQPITHQYNIIWRRFLQPSMLQSPRQSWVLVLAAPYLHLLLLYHLLYAPVCIYR